MSLNGALLFVCGSERLIYGTTREGFTALPPGNMLPSTNTPCNALVITEKAITFSINGRGHHLFSCEHLLSFVVSFVSVYDMQNIHLKPAVQFSGELILFILHSRLWRVAVVIVEVIDFKSTDMFRRNVTLAYCTNMSCLYSVEVNICDALAIK